MLMHMSKLWRKWLYMPFAHKFVNMPGKTCRFHPEDLSTQEQEIGSFARHTIHTLADTIGERNRWKPGSLEQTRVFIGNTFESYGYVVKEEPFADGVNLIAELPESRSPYGANTPADNAFDAIVGERLMLLVGAHYDTVPGSPGANDNGSGVAAMLELARLLRSVNTRKKIRFVAFDNEEHVGQPATTQGSYVYAMQCRERAEKIAGMWSLETLGYFCSDAGSQRYPSPFDLFYPTTGDFVAFVGNADSREWVHNSVRAFRRLGAFPAEGVAAPDKFADINRSDHWGFQQAGYPALMVTDTANFRYRYYHTNDDTPDKVSFRELSRLIRVLFQTMSALAESRL
jgi:hypothetical protein